MYSEKIVAQRIAQVEQEYGFTPVYRSIEEVDAFDAMLRAEGKYTYNELSQPDGTQSLSPEDRQWMLNEQCLVMADAAYYLTRYCYIKNEENVVERFRFRIPQKLFFDIICDLEEMGAAIEIQVLKARQLGVCLAPGTNVLNSKLEWVPIEEIQVGDELVSVDEITYGKGNHRRMRKAAVLARQEVHEKAIKIGFANGDYLKATGPHRFLCRSRKGPETEWRKVSDMRIGDVVRYITEPSRNPPDFEDGWFSGLLDGEGSFRAKASGGAELCVSQILGPVYDRAVRYLRRNSFTFREELDDRGPDTTSKFGEKAVGKLVLSRMDEIFRLLTQTRPTRFIDRPWWEGKEMPGKKVGTGWCQIVSLEDLPPQQMIDLQTSTKTFIAEGFVSHNSTITELLIGHRIIFAYGINAIIGSADQTKTGLMANMMLMCYDMLPVWMRPTPTRRVESDHGMLVFGHLASGVSFQHGSQMSGIGRGTTPTIYHLSEVSGFKNAEDTIEASLLRAVHASTAVFGVLESTGDGDRGWWADTWRRSKAAWPHTRLCPLFLPWFCGTDMYPKPAWLRVRPIPPAWKPNRDTLEHVSKARLYVQSEPLLRKHLGENWRMPREQQWYWEIEHEDAKARGSESKFLQEMCGDDQEALQRSIESVFGHATISTIEDGRVAKYAAYGLCGQSIEDGHEPEPDDVDYSSERVVVRHSSSRGEQYRWELIPLRFRTPLRENEPDDATGKLFVFHPPRPNVSYAIGVDTSEGKGEDSTVISVWSVGARNQVDAQCAEFASNWVSHVEAYAFVLAIAAYYAQYMERGVTRWAQPYVAIEQVQAVGDTCQLQMRKMGYSNFHRMTRYDSKNISKGKSKKLGWYTWGWSRPILTGNFVHCAQNGWAEINSPWLIEEMKHFEVHHTASGKERLEHEEGQNDDRIFAAAMAIFCPHDQDVMADRSKKRIAESLTLPRIDMGPFAGEVVSAAQLREKSLVTLEDILYADQPRSLRR